MEQTKKPFSEKFQDKALDVAGKVAEEGAKQVFGIGSAFAWVVKLGALAVFLIIGGVIAFIVWIIVKIF
jgi:hypothetical protein